MAERVVKLVGFDAKVTRVNKLRQLGLKCGGAMCHYVELELRIVKGGEKGRLGFSSRTH